MEEVVMVHEAEFEANPTGMNRERLQKNAELIKQPTKEEVKVAVLGLNGDSARGPDGMTDKFYHSCWDLIGDDLYDMVRAFFNGHELPKCLTHTNLVLLPKKKEVTIFSDLRPISLSNFSNKVISRVVHGRLDKFLPSLISEEQSGFVKGRNIVENILLTQEIVTDIRLRTKAGPNVILKLDMTKAYDRISWLFLTKVLRKMGFTERLIGIVFGLISNNWYSILINGQAYGFFKSSRGVKQGDPVSPTLFILAAEALSRDETSLILIMQVLKAYEDASGQLVNKTKSAMYLHHLTDMEVVNKVERITGIHRNDFPIIYLGQVIISSGKGSSHIPCIAKHAYASTISCKLQRGTSRHWASWNTLCMLVEEGGIGFRSLHDVTKALFSKLWWNFRTKPSLWSSFVCQKYCLGALYFLVPQDFGIDENVHNVHDVTLDDEWDVDRLFEMLPEDLAVHILEKIKPPSPMQVLDRPFWMLETRGYFSVKSAWEYTRIRDEPRIVYRMIWVTACHQNVGVVYSLTRNLFSTCFLNQKLQRQLGSIGESEKDWDGHGWLKVNTDGASRGNPGRSSIGFCIRNENGDIVKSVGKEIEETTNTVAEAKAMVEALRFCRFHQYSHVWLQTDSMLLKTIMDGIWKPPWIISEQVEEMMQLMNGGNYTVTHIHREGNKLADHLANYALDHGEIECQQFWHLDAQGRRLVNEDKLQCPNLRVKVDRR
ncbi:uncharacterized protein [Nicotiana sylvestris]|uniref:uncharacterized protein n=1 Tax=Nicotiana sylvestris TaxID=4096 RepID=UPI00388CC3A5